jgi:L-alanine-DL-glutamate epimerase-like enolase superfamily enzyme
MKTAEIAIMPIAGPDALVAQAKTFAAKYGFKSSKLKGGVLEPDLEVETMFKLREAFPDHGLCIDPMCAWTVSTAKQVVAQLDGVLEHLEDHYREMDAMVELSAQIDVPLATNLVVVEFEQIIEASRKTPCKSYCPIITIGVGQRVLDGPGLGVALDQEAVAELHDLYQKAMVKDRDDTDEMLKYRPNDTRKVPIIDDCAKSAMATEGWQNTGAPSMPFAKRRMK